MQTYFIQDKKFILVESSICTQSILSAIQLINTKIARSCGAGLTYNSYTFRVGVSVLQILNCISNQTEQVSSTLSKSSLCN